MNPALGQLIAVLRAQADSLEQALDLTERQTDAIVRRELERINALSQSLEREVVEGRKLEERRHGFAAELADALGMEPGDSTLSTLAAALPRDEANALLRAGETVIRSIEKLARRSVANRQLLEHELAMIDQVMRIAHRGDRSTYAGSGTTPSRRSRSWTRGPDGVSTFNGLNIALRGLIAQQRALDTTSHNIANASTDGYSRQEADARGGRPELERSRCGA